MQVYRSACKSFMPARTWRHQMCETITTTLFVVVVIVLFRPIITYLPSTGSPSNKIMCRLQSPIRHSGSRRKKLKNAQIVQPNVNRGRLSPGGRNRSQKSWLRPRQKMEMLSTLCGGIHQSVVDSPSHSPSNGELWHGKIWESGWDWLAV